LAGNDEFDIPTAGREHFGFRRPTMQTAEWRKTIGEMVREHMRSPELEHYFSVKMNKPRAQLMITQLGLYIRHRRDCWALV